jgi:hypothetical protein
MPARQIWVTFFDTIYAKAPPQGELLTLVELQARIRNTTAPAKDLLPLLKLARFGTVLSSDGSYRHDANVVSVSGCEGDYDGEEMSTDEAKQRLSAAGIAFLLYTTPRHSQQKPRWRVLVPFSCELPPVRRSKMVDRLNGVLGGTLSRESWTLSQAFYYGRVA